MPLPTNAGRYIAQPHTWTVDESGEKQLPTFVCQFELTEFFNGTSWEPVHDLQITGYFYLVKKDGKLNETTIKNLRDSLGWDGRSLQQLADTDWSGAEVQLTLDFDEYQGKSRIKVRFINPRDWQPSGVDKDPQKIQSLEAKYGMMFRAAAGPATSRQAPAKTNGNGSGVPAADAMIQMARRKAWEAFQAKHPGQSADEITEEWRTAIKSVIPDRASNTFTAADWQKVQTAINRPQEPVSVGGGGRSNEPPFGDESHFTDDSIPFLWEGRKGQIL